MNLYIQKVGVVGFERHRHSSDMEDLIVAAIGSYNGNCRMKHLA